MFQIYISITSRDKKCSFIGKTTKQKKNADILLYLELYIWKRLSQPV